MYVYTRTMDNEKLLVICNFTKEETEYDIPEEFAEGRVLIGNLQRETAQGRICLYPYEALVIKK